MPPVSASGTPREDEQRVARPSRRSRRAAAKISEEAERHDDARGAAAPRPGSRTARPSRASSPAAARPRAAIARCASATNEPRSRPRTLACTTMRRLPFSRLIWFGPSVDARRSATARERHEAQRRRRWTSSPRERDRASAARPRASSGIGQALERRRGRSRIASGRRTTMSKRRSPSKTCPAVAAADRDRDHVLHVGDAQAVAGDAPRGRRRCSSTGAPVDLLDLARRPRPGSSRRIARDLLGRPAASSRSRRRRP